MQQQRIESANQIRLNQDLQLGQTRNNSTAWIRGYDRRPKKPNGRQPSTLIYAQGSRINPNGSVGPNSTQKIAQHMVESLRKRRVQNLTYMFIQKLKQSITLRTPEKKALSIKEGHGRFASYLEEINGLMPDSLTVLIFELVMTLSFLWALIIYSLRLVFWELDGSLLLQITQITSVCGFFIDLIGRFFIRVEHNGRMANNLLEIANVQIQPYLLLDICIWGLMIAQLFGTDEVWHYLRVIPLLKAPHIFHYIQRIGNIVCINPQRELKWRLFTLVFVNFTIAHCLSLILNAMAGINKQDNWRVAKQIQNEPWETKYIYGTYWAATIMMTVGFGDIAATNRDQALCLIFVEIFSCMLLSYNISMVGQVVGLMRAQNMERVKYTRVFNRMMRPFQFRETALENDAKTHINKIFEIQSEYGLAQENKTLALLDDNLRDQFLRKVISPMIYSVNFFKNFKRSALDDISLRFEKFIAYPGQLICRRGDLAKIVMLADGKVHYVLFVKKRSGASKQTLCQATPRPNKKRMLNSVRNTIRNEPSQVDAVAAKNSVFYRMSLSDLVEAMKPHKTDYQIYCQERDRTYLADVVEKSFRCGECHVANHSLFTCPRLHYVPLKDLVIAKYLKKVSVDTNRQLRQNIERNNQRTSYKTLKMTKGLKAGLRRRRTLTMDYNQSPTKLELKESNGDLKNSRQRSVNRYETRALSEVSEEGQWDWAESVEIDKAAFWKYYFPTHNVPNTTISQV